MAQLLYLYDRSKSARRILKAQNTPGGLSTQNWIDS